MWKRVYFCTTFYRIKPCFVVFCEVLIRKNAFCKHLVYRLYEYNSDGDVKKNFVVETINCTFAPQKQINLPPPAETATLRQAFAVPKSICLRI